MNASEVEELQKEMKAMMDRLMPEKHYYIGISIEDSGDFKIAAVSNLKPDYPFFIFRGVAKGFIQIAEQVQSTYL